MILEGTMSHTHTIADLDYFEAQHIAQILYHYKVDMLEKKLEATVEDYKDNGNRAESFDEHVAWHESIMAKIQWVSTEIVQKEVKSL